MRHWGAAGSIVGDRHSGDGGLVAVATNEGSSSWRCCDTGIWVGMFGSSTPTGDEDNVVILAAAVCIDELARD